MTLEEDALKVLDRIRKTAELPDELCEIKEGELDQWVSDARACDGALTKIIDILDDFWADHKGVEVPE